MRKLLTGLLLGTMAVAAAAPVVAQDNDARRIGEQLRNRVTNHGDRDDRREERWERREERRDDRREARDDRREDRWARRDERRDDRREWRDDRRDYWDDRRGYRYDYRGNAYGWNRQWTPYGFGYNDSFTRDWVWRNFADRNRNGRISDSEWQRAQAAFYRFADRNRDGWISRGEYDWARRAMNSQAYAGYRW